MWCCKLLRDNSCEVLEILEIPTLHVHKIEFFFLLNFQRLSILLDDEPDVEVQFSNSRVLGQVVNTATELFISLSARSTLMEMHINS